jgi:hypothetical protein
MKLEMVWSGRLCCNAHANTPLSLSLIDSFSPFSLSQ